jgi:hypothetical protein
LCSRCGLQQVWRLASRASCCAGGAGTSCIIVDQVLFCTDIVASMTLASLDGVVRTVTALDKWTRELCIT